MDLYLRYSLKNHFNGNLEGGKDPQLLYYE